MRKRTGVFESGHLLGRMPRSEPNLKAAIRVNDQRGIGLRIIRQDGQWILERPSFKVGGNSELHGEGGEGR